MKLKIFFAILGVSRGEFNTNDRPDLEFPKGCFKKKVGSVTSGLVPDGYTCKYVRCKNFKKHKANVKVKNGKIDPPLECLPDNKLGCSTTWGFTYRVKKTVFHHPGPINAKKVVITCGYSEESETMKCQNVKSKINPKLTFEWDKAEL